MSGLALQIDVSGNAAAVPESVRRAVTAPGGRLAAGAGVKRKLQQHFIQRNASHAHTSPVGGNRSNYWAGAARNSSITVAADPQGSRVSMLTPGIAAHYFGKTFTTADLKQAKAFAIPAAAEAYGHAPREFANLKLIVFGKGGPAVLAAIGGSGVRVGQTSKLGKGKRIGQATVLGRLTIMYRLVFGFKLKADQSVLPADADLQQAALNGASDWLDAQLKRGRS